MERDKHVAVVTDSATSIRPGSPEAIETGVSIVPLEVMLWEKDNYVPYSDFDITTEAFYQNMRISPRLPQSSGAVTGRITEIYRGLKEKQDSIISIHITSKMSAVYDSAKLAKDFVMEEPGPKPNIEIVDTKLVSIASWFPVEVAAALSKKNATMEQIKDEVNETIAKTQLFVTLQTFENLKRGGRGDQLLKAVFASALSIYPVIGFENGNIKNFGYGRSVSKARDKMIEMVGDAGKLAKIAVIHANDPELGKTIKGRLQKIFPGPIPIYEAGPSLAVHAGESAAGIAFQIV